MRAVPTNAISGMHMPRGENMWASPADDSDKETLTFKNELGNDIEVSVETVKDSGKNSKDEDVEFEGIKITMTGPNSTLENTITVIEAENLRNLLENNLKKKGMKKEAMGLTSIPGEQQNDYQFEQPFHIKDPDNVGIIDVDTVVDLPPVNYAEDSEEESDMKELLEKLVDQLESLGYSDKAKLIKTAYPGQTGQVPGYGAPYGKNKPYTPKKPYRVPEGYFPEPTSDPSIDEFGRKYESFTSINEMVEAGLLTREQAGWLTLQSKTQSFSPEELQKRFGLDIEYARQLSELLLEEANRPQPTQQAARSRALSGWDGYAASGRSQRALAEAWQAQPPAGFDASFDSFKAWYQQKFKELGRHFSPEEAMVMIRPPVQPEIKEEPQISEQVKKEDLVGAKTRQQPKATSAIAIEPTRENIIASLIRLMRGMPLTAPGIDQNLVESGKISRMTKRYLRGIGADRTIRTKEDQDKVIGLAASAISQVDIGGKTFDQAINERLVGLSGNDARKMFDGLVWQYLQRAWAAYGSLRGREVSDRQEQRRLRRMDRQTQRFFDRARR